MRCCATSAPASIPKRKFWSPDCRGGRSWPKAGPARGDVLLKARFVVAGSRLYQIAYVGERDSLATADIDMFLTSFKLLR